MAPAQRLAAAAAASSVGKKKRSRSRRNSDDSDDGDVTPKSQKKQQKQPAMSAVAARKLALMKQQQEASKNGKDKGREQDKDDEEDARIYTANAPSQDGTATGPTATESEEKQEISALHDIVDGEEVEEEDDGNDSDNVPLVASTSKKPAEKRSKRYFSANTIESAVAVSDADTEAVDDMTGPNTSYSEPSTPLRPRRRAKRRKRGDDNRTSVASDLQALETH
jgi:hypothetical protein